ncbi:MAG: multidrug ABC transporter [Clostridia bacterium]|nr:multidrug ABC transporter [Clostridia bacterium]
MNNSLSSIGAVLAAVFISSVSQLLLKTGANKSYPTLIRQYLNPYVISGYGLMVISTLLFILAYHLGLGYKSGPVYEALAYPLILIFSFLFLHERMTPRKIIGNLIIVTGIIVFHL